MSGPFRITPSPDRDFGTGIVRNRPLQFCFDGRRFTGYEGDSLASALLASGARTVARSFKFHRPRGIYSCGVEEPNALVQLARGVRAIPSARATLVELREGLEAFSQAGWPSVRTDIGRALDLAPALWAAGFYNKTFMWPNWHAYEGFVRRLAGLGRIPEGPDPDRYEVHNRHCDVLIVGAGAAGLHAAAAAAAEGLRVVLVEQAREFGGRAAWDGSLIEGVPGARWTAEIAETLRVYPELRILTGTTAVGFHDRGVLTLVERLPETEHSPAADQGVCLPRERYWIVRADRVVLATGAIEQPLIFSHNDRPGIVLAGAAHEYLRRYGVAVGRRVLIATNNDSAYALARDLKRAGVEIVALADSRHEIPPPLCEDMSARGIRLLSGAIPVDSQGFSVLKAVHLGYLDRASAAIERMERMPCDALAVSGGWNPTLHLYAQAGGKLTYCEKTGTLEATVSVPDVSLTGAAAGALDPPGCATLSESLVGTRHSPIGRTSRQWVDLRHDVTVADLELAVRENFASVEHAKRYTTVGMSLDQGKTSSVTAVEILARLRGVPPSSIGHTTLRPPFTPVTLGAIAGRGLGARFAPHRRLPLHEWHRAHGAVMEDFGEWKRPAVYLREGESRAAALLREARAVRTAAGLLDGSPLGKIEVLGPDAQFFIDRFYINNLATLEPARVRYGIMLRETGIIFDDGTVVMRAPDHALLTTSSGNAARVIAWLEEWHQCEWPHLKVAITPVTDQWATLSLAGPRARDILSRLETDIPLSAAAFPHLALREGRVLGFPARLYRVSYSGELTFEINVPARAAPALWEALLQAGGPFQLQPLGIDALLRLRLEKGFIHVGTDTDGTSIPDDIGWGKPAAAKRADFIGKRSLSLPEHQRPDRLQLVGLQGEGGTAIVTGSHLRFDDSSEPTDGWVTSAGTAVLTGEPIALALLRGGRARIDSRVGVHDAGRESTARVVPPCFYDLTGERMSS
jgi:sarcosine oxidase, subunit alpha